MTNDNERIDDLQRNGYRIIQNKDCFCFGMDAVLLSSFAKAQKNEQVLDLGTGNGVIPILMQAKNPDAAGFTGLEIQAVSADLARRSVELNGIGDSFNFVTTNPPYMNENHGLTNPHSAKAIARHELLCTLEDVVREASRCLKMRGRFYMVHRPQRLVEIFEVMTRHHLEPKRIRMVYPHENKDANMVLIEAVKGGKALLKVEPPLVVYKEDGTYTQELLKMY